MSSCRQSVTRVTTRIKMAARNLLVEWPANCYSSNKEILNGSRSCYATPWYSSTCATPPPVVVIHNKIFVIIPTEESYISYGAVSCPLLSSNNDDAPRTILNNGILKPSFRTTYFPWQWRVG